MQVASQYRVNAEEWCLNIVQAIKVSKVECRSATNIDSIFGPPSSSGPRNEFPHKGLCVLGPLRLMYALTFLGKACSDLPCEDWYAEASSPPCPLLSEGGD